MHLSPTSKLGYLSFKLAFYLDQSCVYMGAKLSGSQSREFFPHLKSRSG